MQDAFNVAPLIELGWQTLRETKEKNTSLIDEDIAVGLFIERAHLLRLLDEARAVLNLGQMQTIAQSMDLKPVEVRALFEKATRDFERLKDKLATMATTPPRNGVNIQLDSPNLLNLRVTTEQHEALYKKFLQSPDGAKDFETFRSRARGTFAMDGAITLPWCGMVLAIERDGHTHS